MVNSLYEQEQTPSNRTPRIWHSGPEGYGFIKTFLFNKNSINLNIDQFFEFALTEFLHKVRRRVLAERTDEIVWQILTFIFVTADAAAPDGLAFRSLIYGLRLGLDVRLIIVVSH